MILHDDALLEMTRIGRSHQPAEACGVLLPAPFLGSWVVEINNTSFTPDNSFTFSTRDMREALAEWLIWMKSNNAPFELAVWHTHPRGGVGPSRADLRNKVQGLSHLVISLTDEEAIPTWY